MKKFNTLSVVIASLAFMCAGTVTVFADNTPVIDLGSAGNFTILGKTSVTATGFNRVIGNIGLSPNYSNYVTGLGLVTPPDSQFSYSLEVLLGLE